MKLLNRFSKSKTWLVGASALSLIVVGQMTKNLSVKYKEIGTIQNGLQVCATRVGQTYTATVIGDKGSIYMDSNFTSDTEECFAEVSSLVEDFKALGTVAMKKMSALNTDINWFHEALRSTGSGFSVVEKSSKVLDSKFSDLEGNMQTTSELISSYKENLNNSLSNLKFALAFSTLIFLFAAGIEIASRKVEARRRKELEDEAYNELVSEDITTASKVEEIIVSALEFNEMTHCSKLLTTYRQNVLKSFENTKETYKNVPMAMLQSLEAANVEAVADRVWEESETIEETKEVITTAIEPLATKVVDHLANKLIAEGIVVDMDMEDSNIKADTESLEQILYYVLLDGLTNASQSGENKVGVRGKNLGSVYSFEIVSKGKGKEIEDNTSISIAKELLADINSRLEITSTYNTDKEVDGRKARLILKSLGKVIDVTPTADENEVVIDCAVEEIEKSTGPELVRLEKGTKRELLEKLNA